MSDRPIRGDNVAALAAAGGEDQLSYVSTAGGAFLEWLEVPNSESPHRNAFLERDSDHLLPAAVCRAWTKSTATAPPRSS